MYHWTSCEHQEKATSKVQRQRAERFMDDRIVDRSEKKTEGGSEEKRRHGDAEL